MCVSRCINMGRVKRKKPETSTLDPSQRSSLEAVGLQPYPLQQHKAADCKFRGEMQVWAFPVKLSIILTLTFWLYIYVVCFLFAHNPNSKCNTISSSVALDYQLMNSNCSVNRALTLVMKYSHSQNNSKRKPSNQPTKTNYLFQVISSWSGKPCAPLKLCCHNKALYRNRASRDGHCIDQLCYQ